MYGPLWFCIIYIYCGSILKDKFNFTASQVIQQNLGVGILELISTICFFKLKVFTYLV